MSFTSLLPKIDKTLHPNDALAPVYQAQYGIEEYYRSALYQADIMQEVSRKYLGLDLSQLNAIADFACHYGRLLRALRVVAPKAKLFACEIDEDALRFCADTFHATAFHSAWSPASASSPPRVDLLICYSLLTHTRASFAIEALELWKAMVRLGGLLLFTFLGEGFIGQLAAGKLSHYGPSTAEERQRLCDDFRRDDHGFLGYETPYSSSEYGIGFLSEALVREMVSKQAAFDILEIRSGFENRFGQDLVIAQRRGA